MLNPEDNAEQLDASELLQKLITDDIVDIGGTIYELYEITDMLDIEQVKEAVQWFIEDEQIQIVDIKELYIKKINELLS